MYLNHLKIKGHLVLRDIELDFINPKTKEAYSIVAFVGENGCGKTTLLNEIFKYNDSEYIKDKQQVYDIVSRPFNALYLRQGSLHKNAMKEVRKLIDGEDMYPTNSVIFEGGASSFGLRSNNTVNRVHQSMEAFIHNMNTIHSRGGNQVVFSSINYGTDTTAEGRCIIREMLNSTYEGVGNGETAKVKEFANKVALIRKVRPDIAITTDVIVGFPGETQNEFNETYRFIKQMKFMELHVFPFSPREGTAAARYLEISPLVKKQRVHCLLALSKSLKKKYYQQFIGQKLSVLFEKNNEGLTSNYLRIKAKAKPNEVKIIRLTKLNIIDH